MSSRILGVGARILRETTGRSNIPKCVVRNSHVVSYRSPPPPHSKATKIGSVVVGTLMWWWVLWHLWHEHEHITGEFPYPDPKKWTDEELGIPK